MSGAALAPRTAGAAVVLMLALVPGAARAQAERPPDAGYVVGAGGWASERFGEHVAVLRAGVTAAAGAGAGFLLLSCDRAERRFRLSLPEPIALPPAVRGGTILVRSAGRGAPGRGRVVAAVALSGGRVLSLAETAGRPDGLVAALGELLLTRPARLDLLVRPDAAPRLPGRAVPVVLAMTWRDGDVLAIDDFLGSCAR